MDGLNPSFGSILVCHIDFLVDADGRQDYSVVMERRRAEETDAETLKARQHGWCLGSEGFRREMLARMEGSLGGHHAGELHLQAAQAKAERLIAEELEHLGWREEDLAGRPKNDPLKLELAARVRRETTLSIKAIAARVHLGTSKTANAKLHAHIRGRSDSDRSQPLLGI